MEYWELVLLLWRAVWAIFIFAYGACLGSLINVIAYRMPLGLSIVSPPSRCPSCQTRLTWRENIPVLGWILLRGRCRFCKAKISPEYPIVEAFTGGLFAAFYLLYYAMPSQASFLGVHWGAIKPEWYLNFAQVTWPTFVLLLILLGSLVAVTIVDAKTSTIPLPLVWVPAAAGVVIHTAHAAWLGHEGLPRITRADGYAWAIPTPGTIGWGWVGVAIGGIVGLGVSLVLLGTGLITRSFADYAEWEAEALRQQQANSSGGAEGTDQAGTTEAVVPHPTAPAEAVQTPAEARPEGRPEDMWIQYPHARREMVKELAFLCVPVLLAIGGWFLARRWGGYGDTVSPLGFTSAVHTVPLWLQALSGALLGYLIGGGVVWAVRIFGSAAFGKEAMGLGDVHLMAAVGACLGWIDATLAFFGAAFVGVAWTILGLVLGGRVRRAMPYGPFLAVATVLVLLCKPLIELGLGRLLGRVIDLP